MNYRLRKAEDIVEDIEITKFNLQVLAGQSVIKHSDKQYHKLILA